jgi:CheY-like chemotaxis protein
MGYTAFLADSGSDPRRIQTAVQGIDNAVQRAADLVKQTLYITRQSVPALQRIHLNVLLDELARNVGANDSWRAAVELVTEPMLGPAGLDPKHMAYMVNELCRRAYEVMGRGFHLRMSTQRIDGAVLQAKFSHAREPLYTCLEIQLAPSTLSPRRSERTPWENRRDLSLASIESIMAGHRGCVERDQLPGDTVVFRLYFPMLAEPAVPTGLTLSTGAGATILVVDDEDSLLHALGFALERHGFKVLKARDGTEAVETFERHHATIALVLCDLGLPRMSGWEAFMRMRQIRSDIRVILMTGQLGHALQEEINHSGAAGFLQKPFAIPDAVAEVRVRLGAVPTPLPAGEPVA